MNRFERFRVFKEFVEQTPWVVGFGPRDESISFHDHQLTAGAAVQVVGPASANRVDVMTMLLSPKDVELNYYALHCLAADIDAQFPGEKVAWHARLTHEDGEWFVQMRVIMRRL